VTFWHAGKEQDVGIVIVEGVVDTKALTNPTNINAIINIVATLPIKLYIYCKMIVMIYMINRYILIDKELPIGFCVKDKKDISNNIKKIIVND
jgi:hypothetical protein